MTRYDLHKRIYLAQIRWEDRWILDSNWPDWILNILLYVSEKIYKVHCLFLGHIWDGWRNQAGVWCVYCDKQKGGK